MARGILLSRPTANTFALLFVSLVFVAAGRVSAQAPGAPTGLFVDSAVAQTGTANPTNALDFTPVFSALYQSTNASSLGKKAKIQVSTDSTFAAVTHWNSGQIAISDVAVGARSQDIVYGGSVLSGATTFYWRIRFWNEADQQGAWSTESANFITRALPGNPHTLFSDSVSAQQGTQCDPVVGMDFTPVFSAVFGHSVSTAVGKFVKVQVSTDPTFATFKWNSGQIAIADVMPGQRSANINYGGSTLTPGTRYYWHIRFTDDFGGTGAYSTEPASFLTQALPSEPVLLQVGNISSQQGTRGDPVPDIDLSPTFSARFNHVDLDALGAAARVQVSTDPTFSTITHWTSPWLTIPNVNRYARCPDIIYSGPALNAGARHYWRIRFRDQRNNIGPWSVEAASFITLNVPTFATNLFVDSLDAQGGTQGNPVTGLDFTPVFSARFQHPDSSASATEAKIQVATDLSFTTFRWNSAWLTIGSTAVGVRCQNINYGGGALNAGVTYYWRIAFRDNHGNAGPFSSVAASFTTLSIPLAPTLLFADGTDAQPGTNGNPVNGLDITPVFSAIFNHPDVSATLSSARVQVSTDSSFATVTHWSSGVLGVSATTSGARCVDISYAGSALAPNTRYYWRLRFWDSNQFSGPWSTEPASFMTAEAPTASTDPFVNNPTSGAQSGQSGNPVPAMSLTPVFSALFNHPTATIAGTKVAVQVSTNPAFTSGNKWNSGFFVIQAVAAGNRCADIPYGGSALSGGTRYYWRIRFEDQNGIRGDYNIAQASFETVQTPSKPNSLRVASVSTSVGASGDPVVDIDSTPVFSAIFRHPDTAATALAYDLQVGSDVAFSTVYWDSGSQAISALAVDQRCNDISYGGPALAPATRYWWRIRLRDQNGNFSAFSTVAASFITLSEPDAPQSLFVDSANAQGGNEGNPVGPVDATPVFSAMYLHSATTAGAGATVQVSTDPSFSTVTHWSSGFISLPAFASSSRCPDVAYAGSALPEGVVVYWRIRFRDSAGVDGPFSTVQASFLVRTAAPTAPVTVASFPYLPSDFMQAVDFLPNYGTGPAPAGSSWRSGMLVGARQGSNSTDRQAWAVTPSTVYANDTVTWLHSPIFDLTAQNNLELRFTLWLRAQANRDGLKMQVSTNGGTVWSDVSVPFGGYNGATSLSNALSGAYGGNDSAWTLDVGGSNATNVVLPLSPWYGLTDVRFRWCFAADAATVADGPVLDSIAIVAPNQQPTLSVPAVSTFVEGQQTTLLLTATDPDVGDLLTFTLTPLSGPMPSGFVFNDSGNGSANISWLPDFNAQGVYDFVVTVNDNGIPSIFVTAQFQILVNNADFTVTALSPARGANTHPLNGNLQVTFSAPLAAAAPASVLLHRGFSGTTGAVTTSLGNGLTIDPSAPFLAGECVEALLSTAITAFDGTNLGSAQAWRFRTQAGAGPAAFSNVFRDFGSGIEPSYDVVAGDLDNDGDIDLIVGNGKYFGQGGANRVYLQLANGDFAADSVVGTGTDETRALAIGDVNNDGFLDVILGNFGELSTVHLNQGNGRFTLLGAFGLASHTKALCLADFDNDGDLDIVQGNSGLSSLDRTMFFRNDGTGNFSNLAPITIGATPRLVTSLALGDIDRDGDLDLVTAQDGFGTSDFDEVWLNDYLPTGIAGFSNAGAVGPTPSSTTQVLLEDFDGDGWLDCLLAQQGRSSAIYLSSHGGPVVFTTEFLVGEPAGNPASAAAGDFNGDGLLDLVFGYTSSPSGVCLNAGSTVAGYQGFEPSTPVGGTDPDVHGLAVADLDSDGDMDWVAVRSGLGGPQTRRGTARYNSLPLPQILATLTSPMPNTQVLPGPVAFAGTFSMPPLTTLTSLTLALHRANVQPISVNVNVLPGGIFTGAPISLTPGIYHAKITTAGHGAATSVFTYDFEVADPGTSTQGALSTFKIEFVPTRSPAVVDVGESLNLRVSAVDSQGRRLINYQTLPGEVVNLSGTGLAASPFTLTFNPADQGEKLVAGVTFNVSGLQQLVAQSTQFAVNRGTFVVTARPAQATTLSIESFSGTDFPEDSVVGAAILVVARDSFGNPVTEAAPFNGPAGRGQIALTLSAGQFVGGGNTRIVEADVEGRAVVPPLVMPGVGQSTTVSASMNSGTLTNNIVLNALEEAPHACVLSVVTLSDSEARIEFEIGAEVASSYTVEVNGSQAALIDGANMVPYQSVSFLLSGRNENDFLVVKVIGHKAGFAPASRTAEGSTRVKETVASDVTLTAMPGGQVQVQLRPIPNIGFRDARVTVERSTTSNFAPGSVHGLPEVHSSDAFTLVDALPVALQGQDVWYRVQYFNVHNLATTSVIVGPTASLPDVSFTFEIPVDYALRAGGAPSAQDLVATLLIGGTAIPSANIVLERETPLPGVSQIILNDLVLGQSNVANVTRQTNSSGRATFGLSTGLEIMANTVVGQATIRFKTLITAGSNQFEYDSGPILIDVIDGQIVFQAARLHYKSRSGAMPPFSYAPQFADLANPGTTILPNQPVQPQSLADLDGHPLELDLSMGVIGAIAALPLRTWQVNVSLMCEENHDLEAMVNGEPEQFTFTELSGSATVPIQGNGILNRIPIRLPNVTADWMLVIQIITTPQVDLPLRVFVTRFGVTADPVGPPAEVENLGHILALTGSGQTGFAGSCADINSTPSSPIQLKPLKVKVLSKSGRPLKNFPVTFRSSMAFDSQNRDLSGRGTLNAQPLDSAAFAAAGLGPRQGAVLATNLKDSSSGIDSLAAARDVGDLLLVAGGENSGAPVTSYAFSFGLCMPFGASLNAVAVPSSLTPRTGHTVTWFSRTGPVDRFLVIGGHAVSGGGQANPQFIDVTRDASGAIVQVDVFNAVASSGTLDPLLRARHGAIPMTSTSGQYGVLIWGGDDTSRNLASWVCAGSGTNTLDIVGDALGNGEQCFVGDENPSMLLLPPNAIDTGWNFQTAGGTAVFNFTRALIVANHTSATPLRVHLDVPATTISLGSRQLGLESNLTTAMASDALSIAFAATGGSSPAEQRYFLVATTSLSEMVAIPLTYLAPPSEHVAVTNTPIRRAINVVETRLISAIRLSPGSATPFGWPIEAGASRLGQASVPEIAPAVSAVCFSGGEMIDFSASDPQASNFQYPTDRISGFSRQAGVTSGADLVVGLRRPAFLDPLTRANLGRPFGELFTADLNFGEFSLVNEGRVGFIVGAAAPFDRAAVESALAPGQLLSSFTVVTDDDGVATSWIPVLPGIASHLRVVATAASGNFEIRAVFSLASQEPCDAGLLDPSLSSGGSLGGPTATPEPDSPDADPIPELGPAMPGDPFGHAKKKRDVEPSGGVHFCTSRREKTMQIVEPTFSKLRDYPGKTPDEPKCPKVEVIGVSDDPRNPASYAPLRDVPPGYVAHRDRNLQENDHVRTILEIRRVGGSKGMGYFKSITLASCEGRVDSGDLAEMGRPITEIKLSIVPPVPAGSPPVRTLPVETIPIPPGNATINVIHERANDYYRLIITGLNADTTCLFAAIYPDEVSDAPLNIHVRAWQESDLFVNFSIPQTRGAFDFWDPTYPAYGTGSTLPFISTSTGHTIGVLPRGINIESGLPYIGYFGCQLGTHSYPPEFWNGNGNETPNEYRHHAIFFPTTFIDLESYVFCGQPDDPQNPFFNPVAPSISHPFDDVPECIRDAAARVQAVQPPNKPDRKDQLTRIDRSIVADPNRPSPFVIELAGPKGYAKNYFVRYRSDRVRFESAFGPESFIRMTDSAANVRGYMNSTGDGSYAWIKGRVEAGEPVCLKLFGVAPSTVCRDAKIEVLWCDSEPPADEMHHGHCQELTVYSFGYTIYDTASPEDDLVILEKRGDNGQFEESVPASTNRDPVVLDAASGQGTVEVDTLPMTPAGGLTGLDACTSRTRMEIFIDGPMENNGHSTVRVKYSNGIQLMARGTPIGASHPTFGTTDPLIPSNAELLFTKGKGTARLFIKGLKKSEDYCDQTIELIFHPGECEEEFLAMSTLTQESGDCPPQGDASVPAISVPSSPVHGKHHNETVVPGSPPKPLDPCDAITKAEVTVFEVRVTLCDSFLDSSPQSPTTFNLEQENDFLIFDTPAQPQSEVRVQLYGPGAPDRPGAVYTGPGANPAECPLRKFCDLEFVPSSTSRATISQSTEAQVRLAHVRAFDTKPPVTLTPTSVSAAEDDSHYKLKLILEGKTGDPLFCDCEAYSVCQLQLLGNGTVATTDDISIGGLDHEGVINAKITPSFANPATVARLTKGLFLAVKDTSTQTWQNVGSDGGESDSVVLIRIEQRTVSMGSAFDSLLVTAWALSVDSPSLAANDLEFYLGYDCDPRSAVPTGGTTASPVSFGVRKWSTNDAYYGGVTFTATALEFFAQDMCVDHSDPSPPSPPSAKATLNYYAPSGTSGVNGTLRVGNDVGSNALNPNPKDDSFTLVSSGSATTANVYTLPYTGSSNFGAFRCRFYLQALGNLTAGTATPEDTTVDLPSGPQYPTRTGLFGRALGSTLTDEAKYYVFKLTADELVVATIGKQVVAGCTIEPPEAAAQIGLQDVIAVASDPADIPNVYKIIKGNPLSSPQQVFATVKDANRFTVTIVGSAVRADPSQLPFIQWVLDRGTRPQGQEDPCTANTFIAIIPYNQGPNTLHCKYPELEAAFHTGRKSGSCYGDKQDSGDPVQLDRGDLTITRVDMVIPGRGFDFVHARTYRGNSANNTSQGKLWDHAYNIRLDIEPNGDISVREGEKARVETYTYNSTTNKFSTPAQYFVQIVRLTQGTPTNFADDMYRSVDLDGMVHLFDARGNLVVKSDPNGNLMEFHYENPARPTQLTHVIDTMGRRITYSYYSDTNSVAGRRGKLWKITDFKGRVVTYDYDVKGRLISATTPAVATTTGNDFPNGKTERYEYEDVANDLGRDSRLKSVIEAKQVADSSLTPTFVFTYDSEGRVESQRWGNSSQVINYSYATVSLTANSVRDAANRRTTVIDRNGNTTEYLISPAGQIVERKELGAGGPFVTSYKYTPDNQVKLITYPEGDAIENVFDDGVVTVGTQNTIDTRLKSNVLEEIRRPGPRAAAQAELHSFFVYEPFFNKQSVVIDPRGLITGNMPAYANRYYFDWEEGDNRSALAHYLVPLLDSTPNTGAGWRYVDALITRMNARLALLNLTATNNVPQVNLTVGTDMNADGETHCIFGNMVRSLAPHITLTADQMTALGVTGADQYISESFYYNSFGQITGVIDPEGNIDATVYNPASNPSGGSTTGSEVERAFSSTSGGYEKEESSDISVASAGTAVIVARFVSGALVDVALGTFTPPISRHSSVSPTSVVSSMAHDVVGNVVAVTDRRGATTTFEVNALNQVVKSVTAAPYNYTALTFYDANDNVVETRTQNVVAQLDGSGRLQLSSAGGFTNLSTSSGSPAFFINHYEYNILNDLTESDIDAASPAGFTRLITHFFYDNNQNVIGVTSPEGNKVAHTYDARDQLASTTRGATSTEAATVTFARDKARNLVTVTDGTGDITLSVYDGYDRLIRIEDALGNKLHFTWDAVGNRLSTRLEGPVSGQSGAPVRDLVRHYATYDALLRPIETRIDLFDENGNALATGGPAANLPYVRTVYGYDEHSELEGVMEDNGSIVQREFDGLHRVVSLTDAEQNTVEMEYDANSNLLLSRETHLATDGTTATEIYTRQFEYDVLDRLTRATDNLGNTDQYGYDSRDNLTHTTDSKGNTSLTRFDGASRMLESIRDMRGTGSSYITDDAINTLYEYDLNSRLTKLTDDSGNETRYSYDALDRPIQTLWANTKTQTLVYDRDDNLTRRTDANSTIVDFTYDAINRVRQIAVTPTNPITTENGATTQIIKTTLQTFEYDGAGRTTKTTDNNDPAVTTDDSECVLVYDSLSRARSETQTYGGFSRTIAYTWNSEDRQISSTYPGGNTISRAFDGLDRVTSQSWSHTGFSTTPVAQQTYIGQGQPLKRTVLGVVTRDFHDPSDNTKSGYDGVMRPVHLRIGAADLSFGYDSNGNRSFEHSSQLIGSSAFNYETISFDAANREYAFDQGRTNTVPSIPTAMTLSGDLRFSGQAVTPPGFVGPPARSNDWELDGVGAWRGYSENSSNYTNAVGELNQLQTFKSYTLDHMPNGNTVIDAAELCQTSPPPSQSSSMTSQSSASSSPTSFTPPLATQTRYEYDGFNRLRRVWCETHLLGEYDYDANGRRVFRKADVNHDGTVDTWVRYAFDGTQEIEEYSGPGSPTPDTLLREFVFGDYIDEPLWMRTYSGSNAGEYLFAQDENFDVYALMAGGFGTGAPSNTAGTVLEQYRYDSYGGFQKYTLNTGQWLEQGARLSESLFDNPFLFQGRRFDPESALYNYRARYMNPSTGRFITHDGLEYAAGSMNLYEFVGSSPAQNLDPSGYLELGDLLFSEEPPTTGEILDDFAQKVFPPYAKAKQFYEKFQDRAKGYECHGVMGAVFGNDFMNKVSFFQARSKSGVGGWMAAGIDQFAGITKMADGLEGRSTFTGRKMTGWERFKSVRDGASDYVNAAMTVGGGASALNEATCCFGSKCFIAGTQVLVRGEDGELVSQNIEDVQAGDWVWSRDDQTGEEGFREVVETYVRYAEELVHLTYTTPSAQLSAGEWQWAAEDTLVGTSEHPFWSITRQAWMPMGELRPGERLLLASGQAAAVKAARVEAAARDGLGRAVQTPVYNFQVKGWHSYFAAPNEGATLGEFAWVHNANNYGFDRPGSRGPRVPKGKAIRVELTPQGLKPVGRPMGKEQAARLVKRGEDVYAGDRKTARKIAGRGAVGPERDNFIPPGEARFPHYHVRGRGDTGHVFYGRGKKG